PPVCDRWLLLASPGHDLTPATTTSSASSSRCSPATGGPPICRCVRRSTWADARWRRVGVPQACLDGDQLLQGAALRGSPMRGGYAGAKGHDQVHRRLAYVRLAWRPRATHPASDSFCVSPHLTPATARGVPFVAAYAENSGLSQEAFLAQLSATLNLDQVA